MWNRIALYTRRYPAKISGYLSALILYVNKHFPNMPLDIVIPSVMLMIGLGEAAQKAENAKTVKALYADNPADVSDDDVIKEICYNNSRKGENDGKPN